MVAVVQATVQLRTRGAGSLDDEQQSILQLEAQEPASEAAASLSADQGQTVVPLLSDVANHAPSIARPTVMCTTATCDRISSKPSIDAATG